MASRGLQIWYLVSFSLAPVLWVIFKRVTKAAQDRWRSHLDKLMVVLVALWGGVNVLLYLSHGGGDPHPVDVLIKGYSQASWSLILAGNLTLATFDAIICWLLVTQSPVVFYATSDVEIFTNDKPGRAKQRGQAKAKENTIIRLPVGKRKIVFKDKATHDNLDSTTITVRPFWIIAQRVVVPEIHSYERTEPSSNI
jgi:hypothetical protein